MKRFYFCYLSMVSGSEQGNILNTKNTLKDFLDKIKSGLGDLKSKINQFMKSALGFELFEAKEKAEDQKKETIDETQKETQELKQEIKEEIEKYEKKQIMLFGDSYVEGIGLKSSEDGIQTISYKGIDTKYVLAGNKEKKWPHFDEVLQKAKEQGIKRMPIYLGTNDASKGVSKEKYKENIKIMIKKCKEQSIEPVLMKFFYKPDHLKDLMDQYEIALDELKTEENVFVLENTDLSSYKSQDGIHITLDGYQRALEQIESSEDLFTVHISHDSK